MVERPVILVGSQLVLSIGDDRRNLPLGQPVPQGGAAVALVARDGLEPPPLRRALQERDRLGTLMALTGGERTDDRLAISLSYQVQLAAPATSAPPEGGVGRPFGAPAAWCWARMLVPSIIAKVSSSVPS